MSHVPTVLKSDRSVFEKMLPLDDNVGFSTCNEIGVTSRYMRSGNGAISTRGTNLGDVLWGRFDQSLFRVWGRFDQFGDVLTRGRFD